MYPRGSLSKLFPGPKRRGKPGRKVRSDSNPALRPCSCGQGAGLYARWKLEGAKAPFFGYVWVQCNGTPPCETGECHREDADAVKAWNGKDI